MHNTQTSYYLENELANRRSIHKPRSLLRFSNLFASKFHLFPYDRNTSQTTKTAISPLSICIAPRFYLKYILRNQIDPIPSVYNALIRSKFDERVKSRDANFTRVELRDTHRKKGGIYENMPSPRSISRSCPSSIVVRRVERKSMK